MTYFHQIIFPTVHKPVEMGEEREYRSVLDLPYWFEFSDGRTRFMVRCPVCRRIYRYSWVDKTTNLIQLDQDVETLPEFFKSEWTFDCPSYNVHAVLLV